YDLMDAPESIKSLRKIELMRGILRRFREVSKARKIPFEVIVFPSLENIQNPSLFQSLGIPREKYFINEDMVQSLCEKESIHSINLYPIFLSENSGITFFQEGDGHLSKEGYRYVARILSQEILQS
ncbi:MAG: hypothetical protein NC930_07550, partial [Candidatus Omnitrophica bacterium]|nr:hypothetical protein [Candidatus Omnitrophota bacterium]